MKKYFIHVNGSSVGPYSLEDLRAMRIQKTTPVWYDGLGNWRNAGDVSELRALFSSNASTFTTSQNYSKPGSRSTYNFTNDNLSGNIGAQKSGKNTTAIIIAVVLLVFVGAGVLIYNQQQRKKRAMEEMLYELENYKGAVTEEVMEGEAIIEEAPVIEESIDYGASTYSGRFNNYSGGIINVVGSDSKHLAVTIKLKDNYGCSGEIAGKATVINGKEIEMRTSSGCKITIRYSTGFVVVEESSGCRSEHGAGCTFDGIYSKEK